MITPKIGLALSGGGYKGIAHAGVLSFLTEQGIQPKILAGTSAGSIVSCLYAIGLTPREILEFFKSVNILNWHFFTFKKAGLIDSNAFEKYLFSIFENRTLDELPIKVLINSTDIAKGEIHVFEANTRVIDAILASSAFPAIFSPHTINDQLYSDGGILNNFATDLIREDCDFLIGSNVCPIEQLEKKNLNSLRSVAIRAYDLMAANHNRSQSALCDWLIESHHISQYSTFERNKQRMDEIFDLGYQAAARTFKNHQDKFAKAIL